MKTINPDYGKEDLEKVEELIQYREQISKNKGENDLLINLLKEIDSKIRAYNVKEFMSSKLGKSIKEVLNFPNVDGEIKSVVNSIMAKMKEILCKENHKPTETKIEENEKIEEKEQIDVKSNKKIVNEINNSPLKPKKLTEKEEKEFINSYKKYDDLIKKGYDSIRANTRSLLFQNLVGKDKDINKLKCTYEASFLVDDSVYEKLFKSEDKGAAYIGRIKSIVFNLMVIFLNQKGDNLRQRILTKDIKPDELATMNVKDMASLELQKKRSKIIEEAFDSQRSDWGSKNATVVEGLYACECGCRKTSFYQLQIRGADEPMTSFITCVECKAQWTFN